MSPVDIVSIVGQAPDRMISATFPPPVPHSANFEVDRNTPEKNKTPG